MSLSNLSFPQTKGIIIFYPQPENRFIVGNVVDSTNHYIKSLIDFSDTRFNNYVDFSFARFYSTVYFKNARFDSSTKFKNVQFDSLTNFKRSYFANLANFTISNFSGSVDFTEVQFNHFTDFSYVQFANLSKFEYARFDSSSNFSYTRFSNLADFKAAKFSIATQFFNAQFDDTAKFEYAQFTKGANFGDTYFNELANFSNVQIAEQINFNSAKFNNKIDFRNASFSENAVVNFSLSTILDTVFVGNIDNVDLVSYFGYRIQKYNFLRAKLLSKGKLGISSELSKNRVKSNFQYPGAKIIICSPINLKIQLEKLKFIKLCDTLDYFTKKDIIASLKDASFKGADEKSAYFELDYLFELSTMYQKVSVNYEKYSIFNPIKWWRFIYNITMGLGYRPFRLIYWILFFIFSYGVFYTFALSDKINEYISKDDAALEKRFKVKRKSMNIQKKLLIDNILNCLYFSTMVFFTFRLKRDILTFFDSREKGIIVSEWFIGFLVYVAFLTLSKSGSILQSLKSLFIG